MSRRWRIGPARRRGLGHRLINTTSKDRVDSGAGRRGAVGAGGRLQCRSSRGGVRNSVRAGRAGGMSEPERINAPWRWASHASGRRWSTGAALAVGSRGVIGETRGREEGGALIAVQSPVLASKEITTAFFTHGGRTERTIGLVVARHFGKQAFERRK